jgi:hypothetical protein
MMEMYLTHDWASWSDIFKAIVLAVGIAVAASIMIAAAR